MSNRDKTLIILALILAVVLLPYFFFIKDKKDETVNLQNSNAALEERYAYLCELEKNRDDYIEKTEEYLAEKIELVNGFPTDITTDKYAMFLLETEYSDSDVVYDEDGNSYVYPYIKFDNGTFEDSVMGDLMSEEYDTGYKSLVNTSELTYICADYEAVKNLLRRLNTYEDPMTYSEMDFSFDETNGQISGAILFHQYAIVGGEDDEREFNNIPIKPDLDENDMRGCYSIGLFGYTEQEYNDLMLIQLGIADEEGLEDGDAAEEGAEDVEE